MTPLMALLLFLLCVSAWMLVCEVRTIWAENLLWEKRHAKLLGLNKRRGGSLLDHKRAIERALFYGDPDSFVFAPGAQWIVSDHLS